MGRRALRKLDPALDLTGYLYNLDSRPAPNPTYFSDGELSGTALAAGFTRMATPEASAVPLNVNAIGPQPFDAVALFGRTAPLEIEVGSGKGLFLQTACESSPEHDFLGIELANKYARLCAARLAKRRLTNGKVLAGDAVRFFLEWLPDQCAAAVHVYFPDPWWKKRHHKRRVMHESFVGQIERVLKVNGQLHFWTDVDEYFQATLELIAANTNLCGPEPEFERPAEHELDYRTHFERRMRIHEMPVYRSVFRRLGEQQA